MCACVHTLLWPASCEPEGTSSVVYIKPVVCVTTDDDWVTVNVCVSASQKSKPRSTSVIWDTKELHTQTSHLHMPLFSSLLRYTVKIINKTTKRQEVRSSGLSLQVIHFLLNSLLQNQLVSRHKHTFMTVHFIFQYWSLKEPVNTGTFVPHEIKCPYKLSPTSNISCIRWLQMLSRARKLTRTQEETNANRQAGYARYIRSITCHLLSESVFCQYPKYI